MTDEQKLPRPAEPKPSDTERTSPPAFPDDYDTSDQPHLPDGLGAVEEEDTKAPKAVKRVTKRNL